MPPGASRSYPRIEPRQLGYIKWLNQSCGHTTAMEQAIALAAAIVEIDEEDKRMRRRARRRQRQLRQLRDLQHRARRARFWVRSWRTEEQRNRFGEFQQLLSHLQLRDRAAFMNFTRLTPELFQEMLQRIEPSITRQTTNYRRPLPPGLKLAVTLRFLATGANYISLSYDFRCGVATISKFLPEVCSAIIDAYKGDAFPGRCTREFWEGVAQQFEQKWNFPHVLGALDGKHVSIKKPGKSGSVYFNYKGFFSLVLLALVDADYKFIWVDVGGEGHMSDAQIFLNCELYEHLNGGTLQAPPPKALTEAADATLVPYYIIGDEAFALQTFLMKPYGRRQLDNQEVIFNYRLSRARRVVENAFGILAHRFRCLLGTMEQKPDTVQLIVKTAVTLHNILRMRAPAVGEGDSTDPEAAPRGVWREHVRWPDVHELPRQRVGRAAHFQREFLKDYVNGPDGAVPWQWDKAGVPEPPVRG